MAISVDRAHKFNMFILGLIGVVSFYIATVRGASGRALSIAHTRPLTKCRLKCENGLFGCNRSAGVMARAWPISKHDQGVSILIILCTYNAICSFILLCSQAHFQRIFFFSSFSFNSTNSNLSVPRVPVWLLSFR